MPTNIKADALPELQSLAAWVRSADMKEYNKRKNLLECVDEARETEARPLLEKLGYASIRVKGQVIIGDSMLKRC